MRPAARILVAAALALALTLTQCGTRPCKPSTVFVTLDFGGGAETADHIVIGLAVDGHAATTRQVTHVVGSHSGSVELDFAAGYHAGASLSLTFEAYAGASKLAEASKVVVAATGCSAIALSLHGNGANVVSDDMALSVGDLAMAGEPPPDQATNSANISITSPSAATVYTNGTIKLQLAASPAPEAVDILVDASTFAAVPSLYSFDLDTTSLSEGTHVVNAVASIGGARVTSAPLTIVVDRTPPTLAQQLPAPSSSKIDPAAPITAVFSEPLLPASVTTASVTVTATPGGPVAATLALSADGKTLTIAPSYPAAPDGATVALGAGLTDRAGNPLAPGAWSWSYSVWASLGGATGYKPVLVVDSLGRIVMATVTSDGTRNNLNVQRWNGASWDSVGKPLTANASDPNGPWYTPVLAPIANGQLLATFTQIPPGTSQGDDTFTFRWDGSNWSQLGGGVNGLAGKYCGLPGMVPDANGNPIVACQEFGTGLTGDPRDLYTWQWTGSSWQALGGATSNGTHKLNSFFTGLALDASKTPVMASIEGNGSIQSLYVRRWNGSSWAPLGTTASGSTNVSQFGFTMDSGGAPVVSFNQTVWRWNGSSWLQVGAGLTVANGTFLDSPIMAALPSGNLMLASSTYPGTKGAPYGFFVYKWDGSSWTTLGGDLWGSTDHYVTGAALTIDTAGKPIAAFADTSATPYATTVWRYNH